MKIGDKVKLKVIKYIIITNEIYEISNILFDINGLPIQLALKGYPITYNIDMFELAENDSAFTLCDLT